MRWVETIRVRSSASGLTVLRPDLKVLLASLGDVPGMKQLFVLEHALYDGDLAVSLLWDDGARVPDRTREGLLVAACLERFGSLEHSVWRMVAES